MGQNGGKRPGAGRKPGAVNKLTRTLQEAARELSPKALKTLEAVMDDPLSPPAARVAAADRILDRGYGKPPQTNEVTGKDGGAIEINEIRRVFVEPGHRDRPGIPAATGAREV